MRVRALVALLSREIFGIEMTLPEMPAMKGVRGIGMSDSSELAARLAEKFNYANTFYHQPPFFDVTKPDPRDEERYDFIFSSEVMEHIPPPVERGFETIARLLQPNGVLLLTTPYTVDGETREHFPDLHEYTLAAPGGRPVLINRRKDGTLETFDNLMFHGGQGATLEIRVFSEASLREVLLGAGFRDVYISADNSPGFGIEHAETWSLPIAARKGRFVLPPAALASAYRDAAHRITLLERNAAQLQADYDRHVAHHRASHEELNNDLAARTEWAERMEKDLEERTAWALSLERDNKEAHQSLGQSKESEEKAWESARALEAELIAAREARNHLERRLWSRVGRKLGVL
jgi:SAM-dependent methyltransferase